jgi:uncharacterized Fe-S cluster protein YjdI/CDGSH-type Zn-finger protein
MSAQPEEPSSPPGKAYPVEGITVWYDATRCRHFAECVRGLNDVFQPGRKPWIRPDLGDPTEIADVIRRCPTGALHYRLVGGPEEEPGVPTQVRHIRGGPLLLRGDLSIRTRSGIVRDTRAALCACGETQTDPFCDGACGIDTPSGSRD